jgi:hypothetical protein
MPYDENQNEPIKKHKLTSQSISNEGKAEKPYQPDLHDMDGNTKSNELLEGKTEDEKRLVRAFQKRDWSEIKSANSWVIFKVMAEFVEGFETLARIGPCVSIFGSARTAPDHKYYKLTEEIAAKLVRHGYGVITGGGPGIKEAVNKGARA